MGGEEEQLGFSHSPLSPRQQLAPQHGFYGNQFYHPTHQFYYPMHSQFAPLAQLVHWGVSMSPASSHSHGVAIQQWQGDFAILTHSKSSDFYVLSV
jgi:hypothetical protein